MKKIKRYYVFIFIFTLLAGLILRDLGRTKFAVIKTSEALAPVEINETVNDSEDNLININTASLQMLKTLDGIGDALAQRIIDYRTENGPFETVQDLMKVSGIGENLFNKLKPKIKI